jgi:hypothetical protein
MFFVTISKNEQIAVISQRYTQAVLKFTKLIAEAQQREAVTQGRSLLPIPATVYQTYYNEYLAFLSTTDYSTPSLVNLK